MKLYVNGIFWKEIDHYSGMYGINFPILNINSSWLDDFKDPDYNFNSSGVNFKTINFEIKQRINRLGEREQIGVIDDPDIVGDYEQGLKFRDEKPIDNSYKPIPIEDRFEILDL